MSLPVLDAIQLLALQASEPVMSFDLLNMWRTMGPFAKFIAMVLAVMSVWSLGVAVERLVTYARATSASRKYAADLAQMLPAGKFKDAVELARSKPVARGYLPKVLGLALDEYSKGLEALQNKGPRDVGDFDIVAAVNRAIDRSSLRTMTDLRRGLGSLATIGSTAPFVGLFGTVMGILNAFIGINNSKATGLAAVAGGIAEALVTTAIGLLVAIPAVMMFNYLTGRVEAFDVEMDNSSSELIDYFLKRRSMRRS